MIVDKVLTAAHSEELARVVLVSTLPPGPEAFLAGRQHMVAVDCLDEAGDLLDPLLHIGGGLGSAADVGCRRVAGTPHLVDQICRPKS